VIAGVLYFDFRPVPETDEGFLKRARPRLAADPVELSSAAGLLMAQSPSRFDAPADQSRAVSSDGSVATWHGRLDNRDSLWLALSREASRRGANSAMAALGHYQAEGIAGLRNLIGDWSLAIWDARSKSVVLASDYAGIRPLYYRRDGHRLSWSSSLTELVERTGTTALDEEYAARFLMGRAAPRITPYAGIHQVPAGHAVRVSPDAFSIEPFWRLPAHRELRLEDGRDYEEGLRTLFAEAVRVRLAGGPPVCAELSGGLDSSSIVCMCDRLLAGPAKPVTFSYLHPGSRDERYIREVERVCGLAGIHLDLRDVPLVTAGETGRAYPAWWIPRLAILARRMENLGAGVLLTGQLGDFIMGNLGDDSEQVADYLQQGRMGAAFREAFAWSQAIYTPVFPILWRAARTVWFSWTAPALVDPFARAGRFTKLDSLTSRMRALLPVAGEEPAGRREWREAMPSRRRRFRMLSQVLDGHALQTPEPLEHLSWSHPYAHRPLVEFMLSIPPGQVCRPNEQRRLMRRAFANLLPPAIVNRKSKETYEQPFRQALLPLAAALLAEPGKIRSVERGFVERDTLLERLQRFAQGLDCNEIQLRQILLFEFWLRNREGAAQALDGTASSTLVPRPGELDTENVAPI